MAPVRLLIDEDVRLLLAETLRRRGYDAVHVLERNRGGRSDPDQLDFAVTQRRAILTYNVGHFVALDRDYHATRKTHYGILVCNQVPFRELLRRTLRCLSRLTAEVGRHHGTRRPNLLRGSADRGNEGVGDELSCRKGSASPQL